jgi:outer membrane protein OmpA-like peptidoglycan-associated protein
MVFFDSGSLTISPPALSTLKQVAADTKSYDRIGVTGHTDRSGDPLANLVLSYRRAEAVKRALVGLGVPPVLIAVAAQGDRQPLVQTGPGTKEQQNRRVEFAIIARSESRDGWRQESFQCITTQYRWVKVE